MTPIQVPFMISQAEKDYADFIGKMTADLKKGGGVKAVLADLETSLISLLGEAGSLPADFAASDKYDLGLYIGKAIKDKIV